MMTGVRKLLRRFGVDITRARPQMAELIRHHGVDTVLDVGANEGQYGAELRRWGYQGRIVSFEPVSSVHAALEARAARDDRWEARNEALGSSDGEMEINVSEFSVFSSMLEPNDYSRGFDARAATVRREKVRTRRLDSIWEEVRGGGSRFYLKVDTQGFEPEVIRGAEACLREITAVQLEISLRTMYEGETPLVEMIGLMAERGFELAFAVPVLFDPRDLSVPQLDCVFLHQGGRAA
jgi:FkbM family methyltransferase